MFLITSPPHNLAPHLPSPPPSPQQVVSIVRVTRAFAPAMARRGRGVVLNVGSATGWVAQATKGLYSASKHAVR